MKAIANSSVLIALGTVGQLGLLSRRFPGGILVPEAVWREVVETGKGQPGSAEIACASWFTVGILIWAKRVGAIPSLKEQLDALQTRGRFHLGQSVYEEALRAVGEVKE